MNYVWEQRKWIDTVDISTEMVDPSSGKYDDMPHIAPRNIESFTGRILDNVRSVKEEQLISGKFRFRPDDVVYGKINPQLRKYFYASVDGLTSADAYVFKGKNGIKQKFLFSLLQTRDFFKYSVSVSKRSGMPKINRDELNAYAFHAPSEEEQNKIGSFLLDLDHFITLHQRKIYIFIKKMPIDWEQRKLGEVLVSLQNNTLSRADLSNETGIAKNVHYGDVLIKFGEVLDVSEEKLPMISDKSVLTKYKASFLQNGDVIVADTAEDSTVGKCSEIAGLNDEVVLSGLHTIPYRPIEKFASGYLGYYLNSSAYHKQLIPLMQGIKVTSISKSAMQNTEIVYPKSVEEQGKIGNYFQSLDHLITLHHRECVILRKMKVNDWEQRKLGEIATYRNGKAHEANQLDVGTYELVNLNSISIDGGLKPSGKFIEDGGDTLQRNDLVMVLSDVGHGDLLGRVAIIPENNRYVLNQRVALLRINDDTNTYFLFSIINRYQDYFKKLGAGSSQLNISRGIVENFEVTYPNVAEQRMIADYFHSLDHLITLHQHKCDELQNLKKYMLQNMFV